MHDNDVPQTHGFDLLVRELLTDKACNFGAGVAKSALVGFGTDLIRDPVVFLKERTLENRDFGCHAVGWIEIRRTEHLLGVVSNTEVFAFQTLNPGLAGRAVGSD